MQIHKKTCLPVKSAFECVAKSFERLIRSNGRLAMVESMSYCGCLMGYPSIGGEERRGDKKSNIGESKGPTETHPNWDQSA